MSEDTTVQADVIRLRESIEDLLRRRVLEAVESVLEEELTAALGSGRYERAAGRQGYRNGSERRRITTAIGTRELEVPRGRLEDEAGRTSEFRSELLPRYQRRTREVDEAILGAYLAGANTRRIRKALAPLLGDEHLSKSAVSRVVSRLKEQFAAWRSRDLSEECYPIVFLDGMHLKVRMARRVVSVPVLVILGVTEDGEKRLLGLDLAVSEAATHWSGLVKQLASRGLRAPELVVADGHAGLGKAMELWPQARIQRCTLHKWGNLKEACPAHARHELKRDYDAIIRAQDGIAARKAEQAFLRKWKTLCPAVVRSYEEAEGHLLTFFDFPKAMWKSLRTTNSIENLNREFRRRTKTQASFSTEESALTLLFGLIAFGQIRMRRIDGHQHVSKIIHADALKVAS